MALDILIVDDERDIRELVAGVLSDEGYECRTAADSTSALAAVDEKRPSLVLLDVWLHGSQMDLNQILPHSDPGSLVGVVQLRDILVHSWVVEIHQEEGRNQYMCLDQWVQSIHQGKSGQLVPVGQLWGLLSVQM